MRPPYHAALSSESPTNDSLYASRTAWLDSVLELTYRNEIEVEVKFVAPLLSYLGFMYDIIDVRKSMSVQVGRQNINGEADWVVWNDLRTRVLLVVEAKGPYQPLDSSVQGQARSYSEALRSQLYILVNGKQIAIYERGLHDDKCILDCSVSELASKWNYLNDYFGKVRSLSSTQEPNSTPNRIVNSGKSAAVTSERSSQSEINSLASIAQNSYDKKISLLKVLIPRDKARQAIRDHAESYGYPLPYIESDEDILLWTERYVRESISTGKDDDLSFTLGNEGILIAASSQHIEDIESWYLDI